MRTPLQVSLNAPSIRCAWPTRASGDAVGHYPMTNR
jgi:hypothetical protein